MNAMSKSKSNAGRKISEVKRCHITVTPNSAARDSLPLGKRSRTLTIQNVTYSQAWALVADLKQKHDEQVRQRLGL